MRFYPPYEAIRLQGPLSLHFQSEHLADLQASGLRDETIRTARVFSIAPKLIGYFFPWGAPESGESALCCPCQGGTFARIKLFPSLGKMKYAQPPKTPPRLYIPTQVNDGTIYI